MTVNKRKRFRRFRGETTHGWGAKKKHRGAGNRGGRGLAGSGKRAHQKKPYILKVYGTDYFGRHGFKSKIKKPKKTINISYLNDNIDRLVKEGKARKENDTFIINLRELDCNKLLGSGNVDKKFKIIVSSFSKKVKEKIESAQGTITK